MPYSRTNGVGRREFVKAAAWSVPVVAVAVATPLAAASQPNPEPTGGPIRVCGGGHGDNGTYTVSADGKTLVINFKNVPDIYEVNAKGYGWEKSYGTNYGSAPKPGSLTWVIVFDQPAQWIQVHSFNAHFGVNC